MEITNNGVPRVGPLEIDVFADDNNGMTTFLFSATANLTGANVELAQISGTLPNLAPGAYYSRAIIDPNNLIAETNEANNIAISTGRFQSGPDFGAGAITVPTAVPPNGSGNVVTTLLSLATPYSGSVSYRLWASTDQMLGNDVQLGTYSAMFTGQASLNDTQNVTFAAIIGTRASSRFAGSMVILRSASMSGRAFSSRTYLPNTFA